jgi:hypothetical protein
MGIQERVEANMGSLLSFSAFEKVAIDMPQDVDMVPASLNNTQYETLIILLLNKQPMSAKAIERHLQYAKISYYLHEIKKEIFNDDYWKKVKGLDSEKDSQKISQIKNFYRSAYVKMKKIKGKTYLLNAIDSYDTAAFVPFLKNERETPLMNDRRKPLSAESIRHKLVSELNEYCHAKIPSYTKIVTALKHLASAESGYIKKSTEGLRTTAEKNWVLDKLFYTYWQKRRTEILDEYKAEVDKELKSLHDRFPKGFLSSDAHISAQFYLKEKYSMRTLDFYLINVSREHESIYLTEVGSIRGWMV